MSKLYLFNYNNYFNRIIKRGVTLSDYGTPIYSLSNTNFDENDGVTATHVVNYNAYDGDYIVITDDNNNIKSRWFVVENRKQRGGQHTLNLRRDLIVDYYNQIINAPALINRAMIKDKMNPLLYNTEGFSFNQIKKNEILIKEKLNSSWYYLYFKKGIAKKTITVGTDTNYDFEIGSTITNSIYNTGIKKIWGSDLYFGILGICDYVWVAPTQTYIRYKQFDGFRTYDFFEGNPSSRYLYIDQPEEEVLSKLTSSYNAPGVYSSLKTALQTDIGFTPNVTYDEYQAILNANGKKIKDSNNDIYLINVVEVNTNIHNSATPNSALCNLMRNIFDNSGLTKTGDYGDDAFWYNGTKKELQVIATQVTSGQPQFDIEFTSARETSDSEYNVIAFPYETTGILVSNNLESMTKEFSTKLMNAISLAYSSDELVDIQRLPYSPTNERIEEYSTNVYVYNTNGQQVITLNTDVLGFIQYVSTANYTFDIEQSLEVESIAGQDEAMNYKISNECDLYRLISPNYNGIFEFSVAKNDGVSKFNIDITLRPVNPYIHINPDFKFLYGQDFNDTRGLICGGDFSLPKYSSQWVEYELRNKNYQITFDRSISHMDFEFSKARTEALFGATIGSIGAGISGGVTGGMIGKGFGAGVGALIGGVSSAIGGAIDYNILKQRQAEAKDLAIDNFSYQLGNIKALPYSINKVNPLTFNNKIWPFVEIYSATDKEKDILVNKITYNSMRVNAIGTISQFLQDTRTFINASIIRLEELNVPTHEANEIYDEIMKGVYI